MSEAPSKKFWFLVYGQVVFKQMPESEEIHQAFVNAVIHNTDTNVSVAGIAAAQRALLTNFQQKYQGNPPVILDVFIASITNLGWMSDEEFHCKPVDQIEPKPTVQ